VFQLNLLREVLGERRATPTTERKGVGRSFWFPKKKRKKGKKKASKREEGRKGEKKNKKKRVKERKEKERETKGLAPFFFFPFPHSAFFPSFPIKFCFFDDFPRLQLVSCCVPAMLLLEAARGLPDEVVCGLGGWNEDGNSLVQRVIEAAGQAFEDRLLEAVSPGSSTPSASSSVADSRASDSDDDDDDDVESHSTTEKKRHKIPLFGGLVFDPYEIMGLGERRWQATDAEIKKTCRLRVVVPCLLNVLTKCELFLKTDNWCSNTTLIRTKMLTTRCSSASRRPTIS
jgi:hypothetical protein